MAFSRCKRIFIAIVMIILFPLAFAIGVGLLIVSIGLGATVGALFGPFFILEECWTGSQISCIFIPVLFPLFFIVGAIGGAIETISQGIIIFKNMTQSYFLTISYLCNEA